MGRCKKHRRCRFLSEERLFKPVAVPVKHLEIIELEPDEFEAIRISDYENKSQIEGAEEMQISRGTYQRILESGRKKIISFLLYNQSLKIKNRSYK